MKISWKNDLPEFESDVAKPVFANPNENSRVILQMLKRPPTFEEVEGSDAGTETDAEMKQDILSGKKPGSELLNNLSHFS